MLHQRILGLATATTIAVMFGIIGWLAPHLNNVGTDIHLVVIIIGSLTSVGIYKTLATFLAWLLSKSLLLRKFLLGDSFLEGTWAGHLKRDGKDYLTLEFFDQSKAGEVVIQGRSFWATGEKAAHWTSEAVTVNTSAKRLAYTYTCTVLERNFVHEGLGVFQLVKDGRSKYANVLDGYATDLTDGKRDANKEFKISDKVMSDDEAIVKAKQQFNLQ